MSVSLAKIIHREPFEDVPDAPPAPRPPKVSSNAHWMTPIDIKPLLDQLEDDVALTMRVLAYVAGNAQDHVNHGISLIARIRALSNELRELSTNTRHSAEGLTHAAERLKLATHHIRENVMGAEQCVGEAQLSTKGVKNSLGRLENKVATVATVAASVSKIARRINILALSASVESTKAGPAEHGIAALATETKMISHAINAIAIELSSQIEALGCVAHENQLGLSHVANLLGQIEPVFHGVRDSVQAQNEDIYTVLDRSEKNRAFIEKVVAESSQVAELTGEAEIVVKRAGESGQDMVEKQHWLTQRSMVFLRHNTNNNRRAFQRWPISIDGLVTVDDQRHYIKTLDLSEGGVLLKGPDTAGIEVERKVLVRLENVGSIYGLVAGKSPLGLHIRFLDKDDKFEKRLAEVLQRAREENEPLCTVVQNAARKIERLFEYGMDYGEVNIEDLITTNYRPIPGTEPVQYETNGLPFYERYLPIVLEEFWALKPEPIFFVAVDRNSYNPVHQPKYSLPQRQYQLKWNDVNSRNKRIMERWQMLAIARNQEKVFLKAFLRTMNDGKEIEIKSIAAPIYAKGRHWGNVMMGVPYDFEAKELDLEALKHIWIKN